MPSADHAVVVLPAHYPAAVADERDLTDKFTAVTQVSSNDAANIFRCRPGPAHWKGTTPIGRPESTPRRSQCGLQHAELMPTV